ncbi:MAG: cell division protein FtsQ/DivIB [Pirellulales bacterium]
MGSARNSSKSDPAPTAAPVMRILWRPKVWGALALVLGAGLLGQLTWKHYLPEIARHPQYQITAERIHISPTPAWIRADIKTEVLRDSSLVGKLSVIEDHEQLQKRVRDAFAFHPWVAAVGTIKIDLPASLDIELQYRRPVAAVEAVDQATVSYLPVDANGVRLPETDFSDYERRSLPRISGVAGVPSIGDRWADERVTNAADLAAKLSDVWTQLRLVEIVPSLHAQVRGDTSYFAFEIMTSGGTRIVWGAAPGREQDAAESPFESKRQRLLDYAASHGQLDSIDGPASVDVRSDRVVVMPRTARRPGKDTTKKH